jgi:hypothetical protein
MTTAAVRTMTLNIKLTAYSENKRIRQPVMRSSACNENSRDVLRSERPEQTCNSSEQQTETTERHALRQSGSISQEGESNGMALILFLGAFAKLRKVTMSFATSASPHGTTGLPLDGFS